MDKRILFVSLSGFSVILNALKDTLTNNGYEVTSVVNMNEINQIKEAPNMIIVYGGKDKDAYTSTLVFLNDYCIENECQMALIGYPEELLAMSECISNSNIWNIYERPFDVPTLIKELDKEMERQEHNTEKKKILVVDDSEIQLRLIKSWLGDKYNIETVNSATQAISLLSKESVDLILLDYEMPVCSGPMFLEMIRNEVSTSSIPVIFLTAMGDRESVKSVLSLKPAGYLLKTMPREDVIKYIDDFFEKSKGKKIN